MFPGIAALLIAMLALAAPADAQLPSPAYLGWMWAEYPTLTREYQPVSYYSYNFVPTAANSILRTGRGQYNVRFGSLGFGVYTGAVAVTAYGPDPRTCKPVSWARSGVDMVARVRCYLPTGAPADSQFTVMFTTGQGAGGIFGTVFSDRAASVLYSPAAVQQFTTGNGRASVLRSSRGNYEVRMPGIPGTGGTAKVTAVGNNTVACSVRGWSGAPVRITILCLDNRGLPADTAFSLQFADRQTIIGLNLAHTAYAFASMPSTARYTPPAAYQWNSVARTRNSTIVRTARGRYRFIHGLGIGALRGGHVQVSAYGTGSARCQVEIWFSGEAVVRCFTLAGAPADSAFTVQYFF